MTEQFKPTESLASIRAKLLAGNPKAAERRAARKPKVSHADKVRAMQKRAWAKINAEKADASPPVDQSTPGQAIAQPAPKAATNDRQAAARKRGMRQGIE